MIVYEYFCLASAHFHYPVSLFIVTIVISHPYVYYHFKQKIVTQHISQ